MITHGQRVLVDKMKLMLLIAALSYTLAGPVPYDSLLKTGPRQAVAILKHIQQVNDDGSYTFGYENEDGSYRAETRDVNGYVTGKYGYIDAYGKLHETEYVAGKVSGRSVGFQARGDSVPVISKAQESTFPVIRTVTSEQRARDYEYQSVDEDEDGFPDEAPGIIPVKTSDTNSVIRVSPGVASESYATAHVVRVLSAAPAVKETYNLSPVNVRVTETEPEQPAAVILIETSNEGIKESSVITQDYAIIPEVTEAAVDQKSVAHVSTSEVANQRSSLNVPAGRLDDFLRTLTSSGISYQNSYSEPGIVVGSSETAVQEDGSVVVDAFGFRRII